MFTLTIKTDNAAFHDEDNGDNHGATLYELAAILRRVVDHLEHGADEGACMDSNGNRVGSWELKP